MSIDETANPEKSGVDVKTLSRSQDLKTEGEYDFIGSFIWHMFS